MKFYSIPIHPIATFQHKIELKAHVSVINEGFYLKLVFLDKKKQAFVIHLQRSTLSETKPLLCYNWEGTFDFFVFK